MGTGHQNNSQEPTNQHSSLVRASQSLVAGAFWRLGPACPAAATPDNRQSACKGCCTGLKFIGGGTRHRPPLLPCACVPVARTGCTHCHRPSPGPVTLSPASPHIPAGGGSCPGCAARGGGAPAAAAAAACCAYTASPRSGDAGGESGAFKHA